MTFRTNTTAREHFPAPPYAPTTFHFRTSPTSTTTSDKPTDPVPPPQILLTVPPHSNYGASTSHWHTHGTMHIDFSGPARVKRATGPYDATELIGTGDFAVSFPPHCVYSWCRNEDSERYQHEELRVRIRLDGGGEGGECSADEAETCELFYRTVCSVMLDAGRYWELESTPRWQKVLRRALVAATHDVEALTQAVLMVQVFVTYADFEVWRVGKMEKPTGLWSWRPEGDGQRPPWLARLQWSGMQRVSRWRVRCVAWVGRRVLGLHAMYPEYIPERLEHCTEPSERSRGGVKDWGRRRYEFEDERDGREGTEKRIAAFVDDMRRSVMEMPRALISDTSVAARSGMSSMSSVSASLQRGREGVERKWDQIHNHPKTFRC